MAQEGPPFDFSALDKVLDAIMSTPKYEVLVGYPSTSGEHSTKGGKGSIPLATLAAIHDLGAPNAGIPARPFVRNSVINRRAQYTKLLADELRTAYAGKQGVPEAYEKLALVAGNGVQMEITSPQPPFVPLKPATILRKGSSKPLIDSGQLRQAATGVVRHAGETK